MSNGVVREVAQNIVDTSITKAHIATGASGGIGIFAALSEAVNDNAALLTVLFGFISMTYAIYHQRRADKRDQEKLMLERQKFELRKDHVRQVIIDEILEVCEPRDRIIVEKALMQFKP